MPITPMFRLRASGNSSSSYLSGCKKARVATDVEATRAFLRKEPVLLRPLTTDNELYHASQGFFIVTPPLGMRAERKAREAPDLQLSVGREPDIEIQEAAAGQRSVPFPGTSRPRLMACNPFSRSSCRFGMTTNPHKSRQSSLFARL